MPFYVTIQVPFSVVNGEIAVIQAVVFNYYPYDMYVSEPRQDKTCLQEFSTRPDTNRPAQPQKLARVLKFRL